MPDKVLLGLAVAALVACASDRDQLDDATRAAQGRLEAFAEFDRWARRTVAARDGFRSDRDLEEAVFAPVRHARPVVNAWVRIEPEERLLALRSAPELPRPARWTRLRAPELGDVRVARVLVSEGRSAVVIARRVGTERAALEVFVAYGE